VTVEGGVLCWGLALGGGLGAAAVDQCTVLVETVPHRPEPRPAPCARVPRPVPLPGPVVDVAAGGGHNCALTADGALYCWGDVYSNGFRSATPRRIEPRDVRLTRMAGGDQHVCGLDADGAVYCWGRNWNGQLGTGVSRAGARRLVRVPGVPPLRALTAGVEHTCGIARTGEAYCWGENWSAQLGGGTWHGEGEVTRVAGDLAWSTLAAGAGHTCGVTSTGALYCWGSGTAFRLEPGGFHEQPEPFAVSGWR
jgi:alpha-tubulin suppressor-like RCC1 family protein